MGGAAAPTGASIQAIGREDVHRITSGQVILDIQSATKELIENALDAGATSIEIRFKEHGADAIEVIDNGHGIEPSNYDQLARKHYTSKIATFQDLTSVQTFGFRGEALSSLCELGKVSVHTATRQDAGVGTIVELGRDGSVVSADKRAARQQGTTVTVTDLFHTLPVRRKELLKNVKREFAKTQTLLQAYAIVSRGVRWVVSNTVKGKRIPVMTITAAAGKTEVTQMTANVTAVFGPKIATQLTALDVPIPLNALPKLHAETAHDEESVDEGTSQQDADDADTSGGDSVHVTGLVSHPVIGAGRTASDRSFLYINGRPWDAPKIVRVFNEVYRQFNIQQYPMIIANFHVAGDEVDINVSPDKRTLFLARENLILDGLRSGLENVFAPFQQSFRVNELGLASQARLPFSAAVPQNGEASAEMDTTETSGEEERENGARESPEASPNDVTDHPDKEDDFAGSGDDDTQQMAKRPRLEPIASERGSRIPFASPTQSGRRASHATIDRKLKESSSNSSFSMPSLSRSGVKKTVNGASQRMLDFPSSTRFEESDVEEDEEQSPDIDDDSSQTLESNNFVANGIADSSNTSETPGDENQARLADSDGFDDSSMLVDPDIIKEHTFKDEVFGVRMHNSSQMPFDLDAIRRRLEAGAELQSEAESGEGVSESFQNLVEDADVGADAAVAEAALSRIISKSDFAQMRIVGQFNLGFILVRRTLPSGEDDLFIVDQHAADEKFNFETLTATTRLKSQRLIAPRTLQLSPADELVAIEHGEALSAHGFEVKIDEEAAPGSRIVLQSLPMSQHVALGVGDLEELLHRLADERPASDRARTMRVTKVRSLLASRACRRSVMIGTALKRTQMQSIVAHLGTLDQPWNCPHGRPTMRHLLNLATKSTQSEEHVKGFASDELSWESLL